MVEQSLERKVIFPAIIIASLGVILFLFWLLYFRTYTPETEWVFIEQLPLVNAFLNSCSALCIVGGVVAIRQKQPKVHMRLMLAALFCSALFLVSYVIYHHFHGDSRFLGEGLIRPIYFFILISHILLSVVMVPMILTTFYFALSGTYTRHRKLAIWTYPIWLYVSVTGVVIFYLLQIYN